MENVKNYSIIEDSKSKKLDLPMAVKIIDAQTELLNNLRIEYEKTKIHFKDQTGEIIQLTQPMFEMIVGEYNKTTESKTLSPVKETSDEDENNEESCDVDEDENNEECCDVDEDEDIEVDSHGNNSNNISFKMKKIND